MSATFLQLTPCDPIIARDGRPFGAGQGNRMRGLGWPLPSVVAGSFRTALVKAQPGLDFGGDMPQRLMAIEVAGVFPTVGNDLYLPAPNDCLWDDKSGKVLRAQPIPLAQGEGMDLPVDGLNPVRLTEQQAAKDFKGKTVPAWWPRHKYEEWLTTTKVAFPSDWFNSGGFLNAAVQETRDHVSLDPETGAAAEGQIFATVGLNVTHLPRFGVDRDDIKLPFETRFAQVALSVRVTLNDARFGQLEALTWHPLGGERRLVHWQRSNAAHLWTCPDAVKSALAAATRLRMVLATPAIFAQGWKPAWLKDGLEGTLPGTGVKLRLVGVSNKRWMAVSGWALAPPRGPKPIRRMVPAGSVYFFEVKTGEAVALADQWLNSVSDGEQERRDGFGLAIWATW